MLRLPVLLYHHVGPSAEGLYPSLSVSSGSFESHIRWLADRGFVGIRPSAWVDFVRGSARLPERPIVISFDDAYEDIDRFALPILARYGYSAGVFVVTGKIGGTNDWDAQAGLGYKRLMNEEQIARWAGEGIEFGAHGYDHRDVCELAGEAQRQEVTLGLEKLERIVGATIRSYAYSYGSFDQSSRQLVAKTFDIAFGIEPGVNTLSDDLYNMKRSGVRETDSLVTLGCRARFGWGPAERVKRGVRRALGMRGHD